MARSRPLVPGSEARERANLVISRQMRRRGEPDDDHDHVFVGTSISRQVRRRAEPDDGYNHVAPAVRRPQLTRWPGEGA